MQDLRESDSSVVEFRSRSRGALVGVALGGLVLGVAITALVVVTIRPAARRPRSGPGASAAVVASGPASLPPSSCPPPQAAAASGRVEPSTTARASSGDPEAVRLLESKPGEQRTAEEVVALARARTGEKRSAIAELCRKIELVPRLAEEPSTIKTLGEYAADGQLAPDLVLALARLPGPSGPDLLYQLGPGSQPKSSFSSLAEQVLYAKDVRPKASSALSLVLDLRREQDCSKVARLLERAKTEGDRRAIPVVARFEKKVGCGPMQRDDCFPCLRRGRLVRETLRELLRRKKR